MKKKVVGTLLCCVLALSLAGCGKGQENAETKEDGTTEVGATEEETTAVDDKTTSVSDVLGGVYPGADELVSLPMGTCINGEQVALVNVEMPLNYVFSALYEDADEKMHSFENTGYSSLATALDLDFQNQPYEIMDAGMDSPLKDESRVHYTVANYMKFSEYKEYVQSVEDYSDYTEMKDGQVLYYVDNGKYKQDDLCIAYNINEDTFLFVSYKGDLVEKLGKDQLAENICNLITVIE